MKLIIAQFNLVVNARTLKDALEPREPAEIMAMAVASADHIQVICTTLQTDKHAGTSSLKFTLGRMFFLTPNQQYQSSKDVSLKSV